MFRVSVVGETSENPRAFVAEGNLFIVFHPLQLALCVGSG